MAHAATWHLRGVPRRAISPALPLVPDGGPAIGASEAAHPCLTGVGWNLAQSLRRYAAWGCELAVAAAPATATLATLSQTIGAAGGGGDETAEALLWLGIGAVLVVLVRRHDPLRRARSWRDAMAGFGCAVRRHGVVCAVAIPVLAFGVFDEASIAAPQVAQQLLQLLPGLVAMNIAGFTAAVLLPSVNGLLGTARGLASAGRGVWKRPRPKREWAGRIRAAAPPSPAPSSPP